MQPTPVVLQMLTLRFLLYQIRTLLQTCTPIIQYLHYIVVKVDKEGKTPSPQCVRVQAGGLDLTCCGLTLGSVFCKMWMCYCHRCVLSSGLKAWHKLQAACLSSSLGPVRSCHPVHHPCWFPPLTALQGCNVVNGFLGCFVLSRLPVSPDQRKAGQSQPRPHLT